MGDADHGGGEEDLLHLFLSNHQRENSSERAQLHSRLCFAHKLGLKSSIRMTKHSKNNTASSIFSYAEYKQLDYGTKKVCAASNPSASSETIHIL